MRVRPVVEEQQIWIAERTILSVEREAAEGFLTCVTLSLFIGASANAVVRIVTDIRRNDQFLLSTESRYDREYRIKSGDHYQMRGLALPVGKKLPPKDEA